MIDRRQAERLALIGFAVGFFLACLVVGALIEPVCP
jgi:tetrahydromethanopterin S-methyltransferase subunit F